jgi:hypothetical protein
VRLGRGLLHHPGQDLRVRVCRAGRVVSRPLPEDSPGLAFGGVHGILLILFPTPSKGRMSRAYTAGASEFQISSGTSYPADRRGATGIAGGVHGSPIALLFQTSLVLSGELLYMTNLSVDLRHIGLPGPGL